MARGLSLFSLFSLSRGGEVIRSFLPTMDEGRPSAFRDGSGKKRTREERRLDVIRAASSDPCLAGLELGPSDPALADRKRVYFRPNSRNADGFPSRVVVGSAGKRGVRWRPCCEFFDVATGTYSCSSQAQSRYSTAGESLLCSRHFQLLQRERDQEARAIE